MHRLTLIAFVVLSALAARARGDNTITLWYATGTYEVNPALHTLTVTSHGTFKVQATDGDQLGHIQSITVAEGVTGTVNLYILRNPDDANDPNGPAYDPLNPWGALDVGMIGFTSATPPAGLTINLAEVRVAGRLGPDEFDPATRATTITGLCKVGSEDVPYGTVGVEKDVYLDDLPAGAAFYARRLGANLYLTGTGPHGGNVSVDYFLAPCEIVVTGDFDGMIHFGECGCAAGMSGYLHVLGDVGIVAVHTTLTAPGVVEVDGDVVNSVTVSGAVDPSAAILVHGDLGPQALLSLGAPLWGSVQIDGNALQVSEIHIGSVWVGGIFGSLIVGGAVAGHVYAQDGIATGGALEIRGGLAQDGSIYLAGDHLGTLIITGDSKGNTCGDIDIMGDVGGYLATQRIMGRVWIYGTVTHDPSGAARIEVDGDIGYPDPNETAPAVLFVRSALNGGLHVAGSVGPSGYLVLEAGIGLDDPGSVQVEGDVLGLLQIIRLINPNPEQAPVWIQGNVGSDLCTGNVSIGPYDELHGLVQIDGRIFGATPEGESQVDIRVPITICSARSRLRPSRPVPWPPALPRSP